MSVTRCIELHLYWKGPGALPGLYHFHKNVPTIKNNMTKEGKEQNNEGGGRGYRSSEERLGDGEGGAGRGGRARKTETRLVPLRGLMLVVVVVASRLSDGKCLLSYI